VPERIGNFRVVRLIGRGGMGAVYEAVHEEIGQRVAIKVLKGNLALRPKQVDRFFDEARAISMVPHPGLVKLFDFARLEDGRVYILMELLEGEGLWERFQRLKRRGAALTLAEALRLTRQIAATLAAVHERGIIHRDLKPENIIVVPDAEAVGGERAKLLDFGIAKILSPGGRRRTTLGSVVGTPLYMSPEQCRGEADLTDRSDVYALGVLCYEMIAGGPPFDGPDRMAVMASHLHREPPPLPAPLPEAVTDLLRSMLAKEPAQRPAMSEVEDRLKALAKTGLVAEFTSVDPSFVAPAADLVPGPGGDPGALGKTLVSSAPYKRTLRTRAPTEATLLVKGRRFWRSRRWLIPVLAVLAGCAPVLAGLALFGVLSRSSLRSFVDSFSRSRNETRAQRSP
jgi:serine/threonine protein kinase